MPRKPKSQDGNPYEIIRGMWEGAYVSHFVRLFGKKFGFSCLTTQELEEALVEESIVLADVCARLLRYLTGNQDILISNFDLFLQNLLVKEKADIHRSLDNTTPWQELTPEEKLGTLKWLIDHVHQEKEEDIADFLDENYSADDLRGICAGQDAFNNVYWYLDDLRLYREITAKKQNKKEWECVCLTLSDWQSFLKQFRKTTNSQEKELYTYLNFELFPIIEIQLLDSSNKALRDKEAENIFLIKREREELEDMLEKKPYLDCSNGAVKSVDINGSNTGSHEKLNGSVGVIKGNNGNNVSEFIVKTEESNCALNMNHCDGHLSITESMSPINNSISVSAMDVKTSGVSNVCVASCGNSCAKPCGNQQDTCASSCSGNNEVSGNGPPIANNSNATVVSTAMSTNRDNAQDVTMQQPLSDNPSDTSSVASNKENAPPVSNNSGPDVPPMSAMSNMVGSASTPATTASVQPLPSNMVNKTSFPIESQYMQQQSQIFVFSTALANKAAESYLSGHFSSIIAFHCAQPGTKSFLEKYPLKVQQFNRQNPAAWLNTLAQMKQGGRQMKGTMSQFPGSHPVNNRFPGPSATPGMTPCTGPCNVHSPGLCSAPRGSGPWPTSIASNSMGSDICGPGGSHPWSPQQFGPGMSSNPINPRFPNPSSQGLNIRGVNSSNNSMLGCMNNMAPNIGASTFAGPLQNPGMNPMTLNTCPGGPSTLTGVKVPDENLTPQQRQHREEQLAMIRKMQQLLFPEQQHHDQSQSNMMTPQSTMGPMPAGMPSHVPSARYGPGDMCIHPGMDVCFSPHQTCIGDHEHPHPTSDMFIGPGMMGPGFPQQNFPTASVAAQLEWQKLQQQFFEERRKKHLPCNSAPLSHPPSLTSLQQPQTVQQQPPPQQQPPHSQNQPSQPPTPQQPQNLNSPSPSMGLSPGTRMQGPPPPYHQTSRRPMQSPHPASPNPAVLSMPSPRMVSGLPSPADSSRQFPHPTPPGPRLPHPSPGAVTPVGGNSLHTTPLNSPKPLNNSSGPNSNSGALVKTPTTPSNAATTPSGTPTTACVSNALSNSGPSTPAGSCAPNRKQDLQDSVAITSGNSDFTSVSVPDSVQSNLQGDMFCHGLNSCNQSGPKQENCSGHPSGACQKEPSLMPVPSPQQIQYLNAFDGQELTIQKQPNTSIRDLDIMSPASMPPSIVMSSGSQSQFQSPDGASFPNTPGSCPSTLDGSQDSMCGRYAPSAPTTMEGTIQRFVVPSSHMSGFENSHRLMMPSNHMGENCNSRFPSAHSMDMLRISGPGNMPNSSMDDTMSRFIGQHPHGHTFVPNHPGAIDNMPRYPGSASEAMQRFRGPSPQNVNGMDMLHSRFMGSSPHIPGVDGMQQPAQFNAMGSEAVQSIPSHSYPNLPQAMVSQSSPCVGGNFSVENNIAHSHLQNLQKMTPPFENLAGNKLSSEVMSPVGSCPSNTVVNNTNGTMGMTPYGVSSPLASSTPVGSSQRLSHFDPIASMAAMSETTGSLVTTTGNPQAHQNLMTSSMNMSNMHVSSNPNVNNQPNVVNFNTNMQSMQGGLQSSAAGAMPNQHNQYNMANHMVHNSGCGPQTVNNTYVNATMSIQQLNIQNVTTSTYNSAAQVPSMNLHVPMMNQQGGCQGGGANTVSCSVTTNHPIMHSSVSKTSSVNMTLPGPRAGQQQFQGQPIVSQRNPTPVGAVSPTMMVRAPGAVGSPFNSTNIQVKASAPNTIQYLPARPQNVAPAPNRPPTLEFLQRYAAPLTNLDNKVPTHNLQYFPSSGVSGSSSGPGGGVILNSPAPGAVGPGMMSGQRAMNMMMGPIMRGANPNVGAISQSGGQMFPSATGLPGSEASMFGRPPGPPSGPHNTQMMPLNSMSGGQSIAMFPNKQMPLSLGGMPPDATQPLPPSMGQSFNYKQSAFYGPTTADPNYAVQFHNFQQQLYATNTRGSQMTTQNNLTGQGFFGPK